MKYVSRRTVFNNVVVKASTIGCCPHAAAHRHRAGCLRVTRLAIANKYIMNIHSLECMLPSESNNKLGPLVNFLLVICQFDPVLVLSAIFWPPDQFVAWQQHQ